MAKSFVSAALLFLCFIVSFVLSVVFSYITWDDYMQSKQTWDTAQCDILKSSFDDEPCPQGFFRIQVVVSKNVLTSSPTTTDGTLTAYETADPSECPFSSQNEAQERINQFPPESKRTCFTDRVQSVRLTEGGASDSEVALYRLRAVFPIIACIVSGLTLVYSIYHVSAVYRLARHVRNGSNPSHSRRDFPDDFSLGGRYPSSSPYMTIDRPARVGYTYGYRRPLSGHDARLLIASLNEGTRSGQANGTCPICLEDFDEEGPGKRTVELPCSHEYHQDCAMQWFRKGSCSCPYCNYDLMSDVRGARERAAREENERQQAEGVRANEREESSTTDADETSSGSFAISNYPWSWPWWNREAAVPSQPQVQERQQTET